MLLVVQIIPIQIVYVHKDYIVVMKDIPVHRNWDQTEMLLELMVAVSSHAEKTNQVTP